MQCILYRCLSLFLFLSLASTYFVSPSVSFFNPWSLAPRLRLYQLCLVIYPRGGLSACGGL